VTTSGRLGAGLLVCALAWVPAPRAASAAALGRDTLQGWDAYVRATESRIARELAEPARFLVTDRLEDAARVRACILGGAVPVAQMATVDAGGVRLSVPGGFVSHWRGSVHLPGVHLDELLEDLRHPDARRRHQEDVVAIHVLSRQPDRLQLAIRMTRGSIVSVTYDTWHDVTYARRGPRRASSRSIATRIVEIDDPGTARESARPEGRDRGFLWRLNSYWRYEQTATGVVVELESLALSRSIPAGLGAIVRPVVTRISRETVVRTLEALRDAHAATRAGGPPPACG